MADPSPASPPTRKRGRSEAPTRAARQPSVPRITREQILDLAGPLFVDHGYYATSLGDIAKRLGVTPPALYWYFPSKEAILHAVLERELSFFLHAGERVLRRTTADGRLRAYVSLHVRYRLDRKSSSDGNAYYSVAQLTRFLRGAQRQAIVTLQSRLLRLVVDILESGITSGEFRPLDVTPTAFVILSTCELVAWPSPGGRLGPAEIADLYEDLVVRMVRA